jgi:hypothetical protein
LLLAVEGEDAMKTLRLFLFGVPVLLAAGVATADEPSPIPDVDKVCAQHACRAGGYEAVVFVDGEHYTTIPVTHSPYILDDGSVLVFPGETIAVQFAPSGDKLGPPISVQRYAAHLPALIVVKADGQPDANPDDATLPSIRENAPADEVAKLPPNTLLIAYGQFKKTGDKGMALIVEHNLTQTIKLDAIVAEISPGKYKQHYTSTCPIMPKMWGNENWPNALGPLVLKNFRFQATGNVFSCE